MKKDVSDMDYEKAYKDALERARKIKHDVQSIGCTNIGYMMDVDMLELIFPELRESEDERIRKEILHEISTYPPAPEGLIKKETLDRWIAWLEKQKEQKPVEWSEEDEKNIYFLTRLIELYIKDGRYETGDGTVTKPEIIKMLKSLRPQKKENEK